MIPMSVPSLSSLALKLNQDQTPPDWADVVVESIPPTVVDASDPARWAREMEAAQAIAAENARKHLELETQKVLARTRSSGTPGGIA